MSSPNRSQRGESESTGADDKSGILTPEAVRSALTVDHLQVTYGDAFGAYLASQEGPTDPEALQADFLNHYWATFTDRKAFIDSMLNHLNWYDAVNDVVGRQGIPPDMVNWNYPLLLEYFSTAYAFHDRGGQVHVFLK